MNWLRFISVLIAVPLAGCNAPLVGGNRAENLWGKHTRAVIVGVLKFQDTSIEQYPTEGRVDRILEKVLLDRGVPRENLVFVEDTQAKAETIRKTLSAVVAASRPGEVLIFYYAGHGLADEGRVTLATYDMKREDPEKTGFPTAELELVLARDFKGAEVILFGDFCNSGVLGEVAKNLGRRRPGLKASALASAHRWAYSTANWTFTEAIVRLLKGDPAFDANRNGVITFTEADQHVQATMRYLEKQRSGSGWSDSFNPDAAWSRTSERAPSVTPTPPPYPSPIPPHAPGTQLEIKWEGRWVKVTVTDTYLDFHRVRYVEPLQDWEEWTSIHNLRRTQ